MEDPKSEEAALNEQREASWGVLTSLKTETKSVASRLGRAGQRAGGLAVHHALKKIHLAIKSKEQACKEEPEKQCRSEPITRVASRPGSPDRHTISSSPSDKDDFFQVRLSWLQLSAPPFALLRCTFKRHWALPYAMPSTCPRFRMHARYLRVVWSSNKGTSFNLVPLVSAPQKHSACSHLFV
jgi:hypothetical protein